MKNKMRLIIFCLALLVPMLYSLCYAQTDDKQKAFMEQKALIEQSIADHNSEAEKSQRELNRVEPYLKKDDELAYQMFILNPTGSAHRKYTENLDKNESERRRLKDNIAKHESAIKELKMKRGDLKLKVIETYGKLPEWWGTE